MFSYPLLFPPHKAYPAKVPKVSRSVSLHVPHLHQVKPKVHTGEETYSCDFLGSFIK
ncbi:hypothetical protein I79_015818 [Cricetulus griseus]|uniref:Uncharacterized protein n=1 Tax=Cricetulus griseus TaxID=10029 RepID=G3IQB8_CRIGR|nr:hypothetical protein I79_026229 [Cricetulus griseus]EGW07019.1 hypothetical protein I79_015818 [Cricetulus griseus]